MASLAQEDIGEEILGLLKNKNLNMSNALRKALLAMVKKSDAEVEEGLPKLTPEEHLADIEKQLGDLPESSKESVMADLANAARLGTVLPALQAKLAELKKARKFKEARAAKRQLDDEQNLFDASNFRLQQDAMPLYLWAKKFSKDVEAQMDASCERDDYDGAEQLEAIFSRMQEILNSLRDREEVKLCLDRESKGFDEGSLWGDYAFWVGGGFTSKEEMMEAKAKGVAHRDDLLADRRFWEKEEYAIALKESQATGTFDLRSKSIKDPEIKFLARALMKMTKVERLFLDHNQIGDAGIVSLSKALPAMKALQELNLCNNQVGDDGVVSLSNVLPEVKALKKLNLELNQIGDVGVTSITNLVETGSLSSLGDLSLEDNFNISPEAKAVLKREWNAKGKEEHLLWV